MDEIIATIFDTLERAFTESATNAFRNFSLFSALTDPGYLVVAILDAVFGTLAALRNAPAVILARLVALRSGRLQNGSRVIRVDDAARFAGDLVLVALFDASGSTIPRELVAAERLATIRGFRQSFLRRVERATLTAVERNLARILGRLEMPLGRVNLAATAAAQIALFVAMALGSYIFLSVVNADWSSVALPQTKRRKFSTTRAYRRVPIS